MNITTLQIKTPEGIVFSQTLAGPITRFLAWTVDFICTATLLIITQWLVALLMVLSPDVAVAISIALYFGITIGYAILFEWFWRGQTIGKRILRLRVVDADGLRLQFSQVVIRNLLRAVDALPAFYVVGGLACFFSGKAQRLGDLAANTVVIRIPRIAEPNLEQLLPDKFNSLRAHPHLAARLRQRVTPGEASVALQALVRRDQFEPVARVRLFHDLAARFRNKVEFPADAIEGLPDEQFVRNVVDVVYRGAERKPAGNTAHPSMERQETRGTLVT